MKKIALFAIALSVTLAAASAQPNGEESPAVSATPAEAADAKESENGQAAEQPARERRICRRIEQTARRTAAQRVCMTAEQWRRVDL